MQAEVDWAYVRQNHDGIEREVLILNLQGQRRRGHRRITWKRIRKQDASKVGRSWGGMKALAVNRDRWRCFVEVLWLTKERQEHSSKYEPYLCNFKQKSI